MPETFKTQKREKSPAQDNLLNESECGA